MIHLEYEPTDQPDNQPSAIVRLVCRAVKVRPLMIDGSDGRPASPRDRRAIQDLRDMLDELEDLHDEQATH